MQPVRTGYLNIVASLPLFVAEEQGFLRDAGVNFKTTRLASSDQLVDAILADSLDLFVEASAVPVLDLEVKSPGRLKVFAASEITRQHPFDALLVRDDSDLRDLTGLVGRKVGVFPGSTAANLLRQYLSEKAIDVSKVRFVPMPPEDHLTALLAGSVDAVHAYEPTTAMALSKPGVRKLHGSVYAEMISPNPQGVAVVSTTFAHKSPGVAKRTVSALERAMTFMKDHDAETRAILARRAGLSARIADSVVFLYMFPASQFNVQVLQDYSNLLEQLGEIGGHVNVEDLIYRPTT